MIEVLQGVLPFLYYNYNHIHENHTLNASINSKLQGKACEWFLGMVMSD